jgi:pimeloyl-ACP methyl ester carboxylesterase
MATQTPIRGAPQPEILIGSTMAVFAPGYQGVVTALDTVAGGRALGDPLPLDPAASEADVEVIKQFVVELDAPPPAVDAATGRSIGPSPPRFIVEKHPDADYAMLETDKISGYTRWVLPEPASDESEVVFTLPPNVAPVTADGGRGPVTSAMRRIVRVVAWAAAPLLGKGALAIAQAWEKSKRPYALKLITPDGRFVAPDGANFAAGPTLLLLHGTFSTPEAGFNGWVGSDSFSTILQRYGNRCLALAHPSISASPDENVEWLLTNLPHKLPGPVDIVCHSRGGLVARVLAAGKDFAVRRVCQVGTPNGGTPLAHAKHLISFLDGHTALLTKLPDSVSMVVLEGLLCVVKLIVTGAGTGLPGLSAMEPEGTYLAQLAKRNLGAQQWFTIGANYKPGDAPDSRFTARLADKVVDHFFAGDNDLVVPSDGCHLPGPAVADSLRLRGADVHHCNYFGDAQVHERLNRWLA